MRTIRWAATMAGVIAALLSLAGVATAATITYSGDNTVVYTADPGEQLETNVGYEAGCLVEPGTVYDCVIFSGDPISSAPGPCVPESSGESCLLDPHHSGIHIVGGSGADDVSVLDADIEGFPADTPYPIEVDGNGGNDHLLGGSSGETLTGGPGADAIAGMGGGDVIEGGEGNDTLGGDSDEQHDNVSEGGSDVIRGGEGDDRLTGDATSANAVVGQDVLDGGPGTDTVYDDWYREDGNGNPEDPAPSVSFDGVANDGRPGENDDVIGIERVDTGYQPATATPGTYVGDEGPDTFNLIFTNGNVRAGGGDDVVTGGDAADAIDGGPGNDSLSGGFGNDTITGGPGQDDIGGDRTAACFYGPVFGVCTIGTGNDTIYAQDGEHDTIDCGPGADVAYVDSIDTVTACETVYAASAPPPPPVKPKKKGPSATDPAKVGKIPPQRFGRLVSRGLRVPVRCSAACGLSLKLTASRSTAKHLHLPGHAKATTLAQGKANLARPGKRTIKLTLRRAIRNRLKHQRPRPFKLTLAIEVSDGAGGSWLVRRSVKVTR